MEKDELYIKHILDAIHVIEGYTHGMNSNSFMKNKLVQDGVIRQLEIIGEASKRLSPGLKKSFKDIPWRDIAGTRDKLIHEYFGVNLRLVWKTVKKDIPLLKKKIMGLK